DIDYLALEGRWIRRRHQPVKDYAEHVRDLAVEPRPHGLDPGQPGVRNMMSDLDAAMFMGMVSSNWSENEVDAISAECGRYKETSCLFMQSPFLAPLETQIGPDATLIIDPRGHSVLVDETGKQAEMRLDMDQLQTVLALRHDPAGLADRLRLELGATPAEFDDMSAGMIALLESFGVAVHSGWSERLLSVAMEDIPVISGFTLAVYEEDEVNIIARLRSVRRSIVGHGYTEAAICEMLKVESLQAIEPTMLHYYDEHVLPETPLADLVRLFQLRASVPRGRVEKIFGSKDSDLLEVLGIIVDREGMIWGGVDLFCSGGLLFATDHRYMLREEDRLDEDPVMYIGMDSHGLVQTAPREACGRVLDLCCGSGVQGLVASRYAQHIVAVDLNPRAIRFARFNAQLNGIANYEVRLGSLYEALGNEQFDCILANPPFVPSPEQSLKFRDGGASGENVLRAIIEKAWQYLSPEGRLCIVTDLVDVQSYEAKLKSWLGAADACALILTTADRDEILFSVPHCHAPFSQSLAEYNDELDRWVVNFRSADLNAVNFGYILAWKSEAASGCDITTRTIHNPSKPVWKQVEQWLQQRKL
ncbi:MAG: methyltransferase, partial [Verrucomicrobiales bacterium]